MSILTNEQMIEFFETAQWQFLTEELDRWIHDAHLAMEDADPTKVIHLQGSINTLRKVLALPEYLKQRL